jgi:hypothetical protein
MTMPIAAYLSKLDPSDPLDAELLADVKVVDTDILVELCRIHRERRIYRWKQRGAEFAVVAILMFVFVFCCFN